MPPCKMPLTQHIHLDLPIRCLRAHLVGDFTDSDQLLLAGPLPAQVPTACFSSTGTFIPGVLMPGTWFSPQREGRNYHQDPNDFAVFLSAGRSLPKNQENGELTLHHYFSNFRLTDQLSHTRRRLCAPCPFLTKFTSMPTSLLMWEYSLPSTAC